MITTEEGAQWGITGVKAGVGNGARYCKYNQSNNGGFEIDIWDHGQVGLDSYHDKYATGPVTITKFGKYPAKQNADSFGGFRIAIGVAPNARIDIQASENANEAEAKKIATAVAKLVAGKITGN